MTVLIVDDNIDVCEFLSFILSAEGYQTHTFSEPLGALSFVKEKNIQPTFLITDYNLPNMTGHELHQQVNTLIPTVKTIIISGRSVQDRIGDLPFLLKPFSPSKITKLMESLQV